MNKVLSTLALTTGTALTVTIMVNTFNHDSVLGDTSIDLAIVRNDALAKHNSYRVTHHSPKVTISDSLNSSAQAWAEKIAASGQFQHSTDRNNVGENLYASYTTAPGIDSATLANSAVQSWYNEVSSYNYNKPGFSAKTGHFTQVVWKNSTQLGCGAAKGTADISGTHYNAFYVVCHYASAGNVQGQFPANVLKP